MLNTRAPFYFCHSCSAMGAHRMALCAIGVPHASTLRSTNADLFYAFAYSTTVALKLEMPSEAFLQVCVPREEGSSMPWEGLRLINRLIVKG